ncbi:hypothetical protein GCM10009601_32480 [Streptomyces thermospinosisporus]|uniref:Flippase-like domain-containing protein n=1 Tax=Streptomyces thermospinosisporus TaxID=161482 RepID=A0ABP4JQJ3_9ACTN
MSMETAHVTGETTAEGSTPPAPDARGTEQGADASEPAAGARSGVRALLARLNTPAVRARVGTLAGLALLAVLLWRLGTGAFVEGLSRIDGTSVVLALAIGWVTTVFSAWRWALVARSLGIRLPLGAAVADYYRALFLNAALPGGVLGDVHRAVRHGQRSGDLGRGVRAVVLERTAGQLSLFAAGAVVLLTLPSPVRDEARHVAPLAGLAALGVCAVVLALRMNKPPSRRGRALRGALTEAREALASRRTAPGVLVSSVVVLAGYVAMFVLAADVVGAGASALTLLPLAVLALLAMGLPLNVGGWGPREGVTAWAFAAAGLGADQGLAVSVVYGVLSLMASLPGVAVLVARWYGGLRARSASMTPVTLPAQPQRTDVTGTVPDSTSGISASAAMAAAAPAAAPLAPAAAPEQPSAQPAERVVKAGAALAGRPFIQLPPSGAEGAPSCPLAPRGTPSDGPSGHTAPRRATHSRAVLRPPAGPSVTGARYAAHPPGPPRTAPAVGYGRASPCGAPSSAAEPDSGPPMSSSPDSKEKYAPKDSARLARSALPFSAEPSEGRPMTPESV